MINKKLLLCVIAISLSACSNVSKKENKNDVVKDFNYYKIPYMPTNEWLNENLPIYEERALKKRATEYDKEAFDAIKAVAYQYTINQINAEISEEKEQNNKQTVRFGNIGLGGATQRQPAYIHVLASEFTEKNLINYQNEKIIDNNNFQTEIHKSTRGYSIYELARWERYCSNKKMDESDWNFIAKELKTDNEIAYKLINNCTPPSFTLDDYKEAWNHFCTNETLSSTEIKIINNTFKPKSQICKRLK